jgi:hypothetical protein
MKMKKTIIITAVLLVIGIAGAIVFLPKTLKNVPVISPDVAPGTTQEIAENIDLKKGTVKIETPSADEVFYLENPVLRLVKYPQYISQISYNSNSYIGVLGFAEYPLIIREDEINRFNDYPEVISNSDGTAFLAYTSIDGKRVLFYGNDGVVKKITDKNIQSAVLLSDGEEVAWLSGDDDSNRCAVKVLKNNEITVLTKNAASYYSAGLRASGNALIWYENFKQNPNGTGTYTVYLHKDGKTAQLGKNLEIKAFAFSGEKIFYEDDYKFYVQNGFDKKNRVFITDYNFDIEEAGMNNLNADNLGAIMLSQPDMSHIYIYASNRDLTQAIICVSSYGDYKTVYYEEGKPSKFLINGPLEVIDPVGETEAIDLSEYYFKTEYYNSSTSEEGYDIYRFDGELIPVPVSGVREIMTFNDTDNFLYETEENIWLYDSKTGESISVFEYEKSSYITYTATADLSKIYVFVKEIDCYSLYEIKSNGVKTKLCDDAENYYLDGETLYYLTADYDLYIYENGNREKLLSVGENHDDIDFAFFRDSESGYLKIEAWTENSSFYNYISTDGRNFVCVEDYLK